MSGRRCGKRASLSLPAIPGVSPRDCLFPGFMGKEEDGDADGGEGQRGEVGSMKR